MLDMKKNKMAAYRGVVNQIITKDFGNSSFLARLLRITRTSVYKKCQCQVQGYQTLSILTTATWNIAEIHRIISRSYNWTVQNHKRNYCTIRYRELDELTFQTISEETLHVLMEYFEELGDLGYFHQDYDIEYSDGVLTITLGGNHGTYVINKQTPNRQIWLSSPTSGPKRYDFTESSCWIYHHNGVSLHELLSEEISDVTGQSISFTDLQYGGGTKSANK